MTPRLSIIAAVILLALPNGTARADDAAFTKALTIHRSRDGMSVVNGTVYLAVTPESIGVRNLMRGISTPVPPTYVASPVHAVNVAVRVPSPVTLRRDPATTATFEIAPVLTSAAMSRRSSSDNTVRPLGAVVLKDGVPTANIVSFVELGDVRVRDLPPPASPRPSPTTQPNSLSRQQRRIP